jgi:preprotein translocase subunit SecG
MHNALHMVSIVVLSFWLLLVLILVNINKHKGIEGVPQAHLAQVPKIWNNNTRREGTV